MRNSFLLLAMVGLLAACGGKQNTDATDAAVDAVEEAVQPSHVRVINAANTPPLRVRAGDVTLTPAPVGAGQWSERFEAPPGPHSLTFGPSGGGEAFATTDVALTPGASYSLVLIGDYTSAIRATMPRVVALEDAPGTPAAGNAHVRFVHAAVGVGDVTLSDGDGRGFASGLGYGEASGWVPVAGGNSTVQIATGGEIVASIPAPFTAGFITTVVITADDNGVAAKFVNERAD